MTFCTQSQYIHTKSVKVVHFFFNFKHFVFQAMARGRGAARLGQAREPAGAGDSSQDNGPDGLDGFRRT